MGKIKKSKAKKRKEPYKKANAMDTEQDGLNENDRVRNTRGKILQRHKLEYKKLRDEVEKMKDERSICAHLELSGRD